MKRTEISARATKDTQERRASGRRPGSRRAAIMRRATEIFEEKGFAQTTVDDIAGAVGVTREAIYYYFQDKTEILYEIIKPESETLALGMQRLIALELPAREKLAMAVQNHLSRFNPNYLEMVIAQREFMKRDLDPRIASLRQTWKTYEQHWVDLVRAGQEEGDFSPDLNPKLTAFAILGMCNSPSTWFDPSRSISLEELCENFVHLAMRGIVQNPDSSLERNQA
jgi:AcrR family transcriptional regulator